MPHFSSTSQQINLDKVEQLFCRPPNWLIRSGNLLLASFLIVVLILSYFIKYSDTVSSIAKIKASTSPAEIVALSHGNLLQVYANEGDRVKAGDILAVVGSNADPEQMAALEVMTQRMTDNHDNLDFLREYRNTNYNRLGDIQSFYSQYKEHIVTLISLLESFEIQAYQKNLENSERSYLESASQLTDKLQLVDKAITDSTNDLALHQHLLDKGLTTQAHLLDKRNALNQLKIQRHNVIGEKTSLENGLSLMRQNLNLVIAENEDAKVYQRNIIVNKAFDLIASINQWEHDHLLLAPIAGIITTTKSWDDNQYINTGEVFAKIVVDEYHLLAELQVPQGNIGKLKLGQKVKIELDSFNSSHFGSLTGLIESISLIPEEGFYLVKVALPRQLTTTTGKLLPKRIELAGEGTIITEKLSLFERMLNKLLVLRAEQQTHIL